MMTTAVLVVAAIVFLGTAFVLTAAETGLTYLPRADAEAIARDTPDSSAARILATPTAHLQALRFWSVWFETASAVAVALAMFDGLIPHFSPAGAAALAASRQVVSEREMVTYDDYVEAMQPVRERLHAGGACLGSRMPFHASAGERQLAIA